MSEQITIYDLAKTVGVSPRTVSRFFNHPELLAQRTRSLLAAEIDRTGFRPSAIANRLSNGELDAVAVLAYAGGILSELHRLLLGLLSVDMARHGRDLLLIGVDASNEERVISEHIRRRRLGRLLMLTPATERMCKEITRAELPTISVNWRPASLPENRYVGIDYRDSAQAYASQLLARRPMARLIYVTPQLGQDDRGIGIDHAAREVGCTPLQIGVAPGTSAVARSDATLETILQMVVPGTLVLCWSDLIAVGILGAAQRKGVEVPGHFSLAGFDGLEIGELIHPTLTTALQPWREMARHAADLLAAKDSASADVILPITVRWGGTHA